MSAIHSILGKALAIEFCHGWTPEVADSQYQYRISTVAHFKDGSDTGSSSYWHALRITFILYVMLLFVAEVAAYGVLFRGFYKHDKGMINSLGLEAVNKRTRK